MRWWCGWVLLLWTCSLEAANNHGEARLAIIIDDIGYNPTLSFRAANLPGNFTLSVLPFTPHGGEAATIAQRQGKELMLHVPMSNLANLPLGAGGLYSGMTKDQLTHVLRQDLNNIPHIKGINNHMGSRLTQEPDAMSWVMEELRLHNLYFVDSRTSAKTKALESARAAQVPSIKRDVFLDDIQEPAAIKESLARAARIAHQQGSAVAIGHPYLSTLQVLENIQPFLTEQQLQLVFISQLIKFSPEIKAKGFDTVISLDTATTEDYCPAPPFFLLNGYNQNITLDDIPYLDVLDGFVNK